MGIIAGQASISCFETLLGVCFSTECYAIKYAWILSRDYFLKLISWLFFANA